MKWQDSGLGCQALLLAAQTSTTRVQHSLPTEHLAVDFEFLKLSSAYGANVMSDFLLGHNEDIRGSASR
eukprot:1165240-Amphidinium_carterae.1